MKRTNVGTEPAAMQNRQYRNWYSEKTDTMGHDSYANTLAYGSSLGAGINTKRGNCLKCITPGMPYMPESHEWIK